jgi:deoxycytidylate deaminase
MGEFMIGRCVKQTTIAIIKNNGQVFAGTNSCETPQSECPRKGMATGQGYELCHEICGQTNHAEVDACIRAGEKARGGTLFLIGHYYFCDNCIAVMKEYGIKEWHILQEVI